MLSIQTTPNLIMFFDVSMCKQPYKGELGTIRILEILEML